jgi:hypothetical protein
MPSSTKNNLVGLIVIETAAGHDLQPLAGDDATLAQVLRRLAGEPVAPAPRFPAAPPCEPALVTADCVSLGAELEQTTRHLRRRLTAAARLK